MSFMIVNKSGLLGQEKQDEQVTLRNPVIVPFISVLPVNSESNQNNQ